MRRTVCPRVRPAWCWRWAKEQTIHLESEQTTAAHGTDRLRAMTLVSRWGEPVVLAGDSINTIRSSKECA